MPTNTGLYDFGLLGLPETASRACCAHFQKVLSKGALNALVTKVKLPDGRDGKQYAMSPEEGSPLKSINGATLPPTHEIQNAQLVSIGRKTRCDPF
jgi:hypothetical protein